MQFPQRWILYKPRKTKAGQRWMEVCLAPAEFQSIYGSYREVNLMKGILLKISFDQHWSVYSEVKSPLSEYKNTAGREDSFIHLACIDGEESFFSDQPAGWSGKTKTNSRMASLMACFRSVNSSPQSNYCLYLVVVEQRSSQPPPSYRGNCWENAMTKFTNNLVVRTEIKCNHIHSSFNTTNIPMHSTQVYILH